MGLSPQDYQFLRECSKDETAYQKMLSWVYQQQPTSPLPPLLLERITTALPAIIYIYDLDKNTTIYTTQSVSRLLGYEAQEIHALGNQIAAHLMTTGDFKHLPNVLARFKNAHDDEVFQQTLQLRHVNGDYRWFHLNEVIYTRHPDGAPSEILGVMFDVTENKQAELEVQAKQRLIENIMYTVPDVIYIYDLDEGRNIFANRQLTQLLGLSVEASQEAGLLPGLIHPDDLGLAQQAITDLKAAPDGQLVEAEWRMRHLDGSWRWILSRLTPFKRHSDGQLWQIVGMAQDITPTKEIEQAMREQERLSLELYQQRELNASRQKILEIVNHGLRTPLTIMLASADMLYHYHDQMPRAKQQDRLRQIQEQAHCMASILDDVTEIVSAQTAQLVPHFSTFDLKAFLTEKIKLWNAKPTMQHPISLHTDGKPYKVSADQAMLHTLLNNLLSNATKYSPPGCEIRVGIATHNGRVQLTIQDKGMGIPASDLPLVFEAFYRGKNVGQITGLGLGLNIVKGVVDLHRGSISLESQLDQGTQVIIHLPILETEAQLLS